MYAFGFRIYNRVINTLHPLSFNILSIRSHFLHQDTMHLPRSFSFYFARSPIFLQDPRHL